MLGARSSKVDEFKFYAQQCGVKNFIACLRTESYQIQPEPNMADQFGFNQPVVDAMLAQYDVNIMTDPRFNCYNSANLHDPMVENWRTLRGGPNGAGSVPSRISSSRHRHYSCVPQTTLPIPVERLDDCKIQRRGRPY